MNQSFLMKHEKIVSQFANFMVQIRTRYHVAKRYPADISGTATQAYRATT